MMQSASETKENDKVPEQLVRLLAKSRELRKSEDVFEIAHGLFRASFVRQLHVATRFGMYSLDNALYTYEDTSTLSAML